MNYGLPYTVTIDGKETPIRTDFRVILDIMEVINDPDLEAGEKGAVILAIFYPDIDTITNLQEAVEQCYSFLDGGVERDTKRPSPRLVDWEKDFSHIIAPVNRVLGYEARSVPYDPIENTGGLHWWTFLAAYMEIGHDCTMSYIVTIRDKLARGKKLEKEERKWYNDNRDIVDIQRKMSEKQLDILKEWT